MLDMALATFNKLPLTQDMKFVYLNLGLDDENRGQRDKAFVAYKKVFDVDPRYEDVAVRMERLSQAGTGVYLATAMPVTAPPLGATPGVVPRRTAPPSVPTPTPGEAPTELAGGAGTPAAAYQSPIPQQSPSPQQTPGAAGPRQTPMASMGAAGMSMTSAPGGPRRRARASAATRSRATSAAAAWATSTWYATPSSTARRRSRRSGDDSDLDPKQVIESRQRFYREGQTAGNLTHPNIVTVYDVGEDLGMSYIVMEYVEGQTLAQLDEEAAASAWPRSSTSSTTRRWRWTTPTRTASSTATSSPTTSWSSRRAP